MSWYMDEVWEAMKDVYERIKEHQDDTVGGVIPDSAHLRLMKVSEEAGEVVRAYIGVTGANKRKGTYAKSQDVSDELCDVIITAMVALHDWSSDPKEAFERVIGRLTDRVYREGS